MKYVLIIGDGMADNPVPELGGKTPVQTANIPTIDALAADGIVGSTCNCPKPLPAGSETAILSIFGCDPLTRFTGRSPMEAVASGIEMVEGDAAFRCNLMTLEDGDMPMEEKKIISHSAGSIEAEDALETIGVLLGDPVFAAELKKARMDVHTFPDYRQIVIQHHSDISGIHFTAPHDHFDEPCGPYFPSGNERAEVFAHLMRLAHRILDHHPVTEKRRAAGKLPANAVWFWAQGTAASLPSFEEEFGLTGAVVSAVPLCQGIGLLRGMERVEVEGATGELHTNYEGKVAAVLQKLKEHDFVCLHLEAPDECTHSGNLKGKLQAIEWLDSRLVAPIVKGLREQGEDFRLLILSDHKTLTVTRCHDADPVPFLLYDSRCPTGHGGGYDEAFGAKGPFVPNGWEMMACLLERKKLF